MGDSGQEQVAASIGPGFVCLDAMVLIHFNRVGRPEVLKDWFGPRVFTAHVIAECELSESLARHPENKAILQAEWLEAVRVDVIEDIRFVGELRQRWGSKDDRDRGEAEVIALCRRYGWTAVMDDEVGRNAATDHGVPRVHMLTVMLAAASCGLVSSAEAWKLHCSIERERRRAVLTAEEVHRPVFMKCVEHFSRVGAKLGNPRWPGILAVKGLDDIVIWTRRNT